MKIKTLTDLDKISKDGLKSIYPAQTKISVGMATCGLATGAQEVYDTLQENIDKQKNNIILTRSGCLGYCQREPIVDVLIPGNPRLTYMEMTPEKAIKLLSALANGGIYTESLLCQFKQEELLLLGKKQNYKLSADLKELHDVPLYREVPFFSKQKKVVLRNCGFINPDSIEEYIARGGYRALYKVLSGMKPTAVIEQVKASGLRGRGGAGFPTGRKWEFCRKAKASPKYIICNADEGDPGAYMDRSVLEGDPHSVLEGMIIGAFAIGASAGYIYVRMEYPLAIEKLETAIARAGEYGLLGQDIFGCGFNFNVEIIQGAGAFVCGEETSLIASIEGRPPEPRQRPPFPAQQGVWGKPTNINNVETWANIPFIMQRGAEYFAGIGNKDSSGTKVFSLVGDVKNNGLIEVPMGITLREIIYDIGQGIIDNKKFKAVQTGGPSGGCVPHSLIDIPVDFEKLKQAGSIMGSGGMVVMDENACIVDIAKFFISFTRDESCGKCTSCREGSDALLEVLERISAGEGQESDLEFLEELSKAIKDASLCGLGQTLPNPVLSTLKHFRDEYIAHIRHKRCPALKCKAFIKYIITDQCTGCKLCFKQCSVKAIKPKGEKQYEIDVDKCIRCGVCISVCRFDAIKIVALNK